MPDHVHLVVKAPATLCACDLMQTIKGVSSTALRESHFKGQAFGWQDKCGVFSLLQRDLKEVIPCVHNQKARHAQDKLKLSLEDCDEDVP